MPSRAIPYVKVLVHVLCLIPFFLLLRDYWSGALLLMADPINFITHFTGDWALWMLLASLTVTPLRRLHPVLSNLIRFRRMLGLYAFFYATLHLATYIFLFSGFDLPAAWEGLTHGRPGAVVAQWRQTWPIMVSDLVKRRFIQVGLFSWFILLLLALTSPMFMLRKMGGKSWQRLHRLVYAAAAGGCIHYWWMVKNGVRRPMPDTLVLTGLLLARVVWVIWKRLRVRPNAAALRRA